MESDSFNAISWMNSTDGHLMRFFHRFKEIMSLSSFMQVTFQHAGQTANGMVDPLARRGLDRIIRFSAAIYLFIIFCIWHNALYLCFALVRLWCFESMFSSQFLIKFTRCTYLKQRGN